MMRKLWKRHDPAQDASSTSIAPPAECAENLTMIEAFEWYSEGGGRHWKYLQDLIPLFKSIGMDNVWLPPGCKAGVSDSNGYDIYDHFDIGEFDQKGSRATKWGTKEELLELCSSATAHGIGLYWDAILNHKNWADRTENVRAVKVNPSDRTEEISKPQEIESWSQYDFIGRGDTYSSMRYDSRHFNGTDFDQRTNTNAIYKLVGPGRKGWASDVDKEKGNYDFLLCSNYDLSHPDVRQDLLNWGDWIADQLPLAGIRLDAAKHISQGFMRDWLAHMDLTRPNWFYVGEYCSSNLEVLTSYIRRMDHRLSLFDFPLHSTLVRISWDSDADLRNMLDGSLTSVMPANAVTFVTNHDTQRTDQAFENRVHASFQPHAHALLLLHASSTPCIFLGDLLGTHDPTTPLPPSCAHHLPTLLLARKLWAYGPQHDYLDAASCIGWTREGHAKRCGGAGIAVLLSWGAKSGGRKRMFVGEGHAGEVWTDVLGWGKGEVRIEGDGWGWFEVGADAVAVWASAAAAGRKRVEAASGAFYAGVEEIERARRG